MGAAVGSFPHSAIEHLCVLANVHNTTLGMFLVESRNTLLNPAMDGGRWRCGTQVWQNGIQVMTGEIKIRYKRPMMIETVCLVRICTSSTHAKPSSLVALQCRSWLC